MDTSRSPLNIITSSKSYYIYLTKYDKGCQEYSSILKITYIWRDGTHGIITLKDYTGNRRGQRSCGVAVELGKAGATVYITGRSTKGRTTNNWPGTIDDTVSRRERNSRSL